MLAPRTGLEPVTYRLTADRSTIELSRKVCVLSERLQYTTLFRISSIAFFGKFDEFKEIALELALKLRGLPASLALPPVFLLGLIGQPTCDY